MIMLHRVFLDSLDEFLDPDRFGQIFVGSGDKSGRNVINRGSGREKDDGNICVSLFFADNLTELCSAHVRHDNIGDNQIDGGLREE